MSSSASPASTVEMALLQRLMMGDTNGHGGGHTGVQDQGGAIASSSYHRQTPSASMMDDLLANSIPSQTSGNQQGSHIGNNHMHQNAYPSMHHNYQHQPSSAASAMMPSSTAGMMPQQYNHNDLDLLLSRYGYGYPSFESSAASLRAGNDQPFPRTSSSSSSRTNSLSQQAAATAHSSLMQFGAPELAIGSQNSTFQNNSFAPLSGLEPPGANIFFQGTAGGMLGTDDWMSMQRSSAATLQSMIPLSNAPSMSRFDSNPPSNLPSSASSSDQSQLANAILAAGRLEEQSATSSSLRALLPTSLASSDASSMGQQQNHVFPPTNLAIPSDTRFLDPVHMFLRSISIELFITTNDHMMCPGRGARPSKVGQVGLRCAYCKNVPRQDLTRQAICYPSKRDTIFESVRNYQRVHLEECPCISQQIKIQYKNLLEADSPNKKSQRFVKAYYSEAATELGLVDSPKGLVFGALPNTSGTPSAALQAIMRAAESPATSSEFWKNYSSNKDKSMELRKFEHVASEKTKDEIKNARKEASAFVFPQDFPTVSDAEFLLYKQVLPCRPSMTALKRRGIDPEECKALSGMCCKHCARVHKGESHHNGMYFPMNISTLSDSSFSQSLLKHVMACPNVPRELKDALEELQQLASDHCVVAKRGSRKRFLEKIWGRMQNYYAE